MIKMNVRPSIHWIPIHYERTKSLQYMSKNKIETRRGRAYSRMRAVESKCKMDINRVDEGPKSEDRSSIKVAKTNAVTYARPLLGRQTPPLAPPLVEETVWNPSSSFFSSSFGAGGAGEPERGVRVPATREGTAGATAGAGADPPEAALACSRSRHPPPPRAPGRYLAGAGLSERGGGAEGPPLFLVGVGGTELTGVEDLRHAAGSSLAAAAAARGLPTGAAAGSFFRAARRASASSSRCCCSLAFSSAS